MPHKPNPACLLFLWIKFCWNTVMLTLLQNDFFFSRSSSVAHSSAWCLWLRDAVMSSGLRSRTPEIHEQRAEWIYIYSDRDFVNIYTSIVECFLLLLFPSYFPLPLALEQFRVGALTLHAVENPHGNYSCPSSTHSLHIHMVQTPVVQEAIQYSLNVT